MVLTGSLRGEQNGKMAGTIRRDLILGFCMLQSVGELKGSMQVWTSF